MIEKENLRIWENIFQNKEWGKYPPIPLVRFIAKNFYSVPDRKQIKILELGFGTGANLWYLAREGFSVYGIEGSKTAVEKAIKRFEYEGVYENIKDLLVGDYYELLNNFKDSFFDCIIDLESLAYNSLERTKNIIQTSANKLKKGGKFFSITFSLGCWGSENAQSGEMLQVQEGPLKDSTYVRFLSLSDIYEIYENEVLKIKEIQQDIYIYMISKMKRQ